MQGSSSSSERTETWWGGYELAEGELARWQLGSLTLWVERRPLEWRVATVMGSEPMDRRLEIRRPVDDAEEIPELAIWRRLPKSAPSGQMELLPRTADRAVVARPDDPVYLPPREQVVVYVGSPLWVEVRQSDSGRTLLDTPGYRPSDTWFGSSTKDGELCYASRTAARLDLSRVQPNPIRALTSLTVRNDAADDLLLERVRIPVQSLGLYLGEQGRLWTPPISVRRGEGGGLAQVDVGSGAPPEAGATATLLSPPRQDPGPGTLVDTLAALIG